MKRTRRVVVLLVLGAVAAYFGIREFLRSPAATAPGLRVSGVVEVTDAEISFQVAGRVAERLVSEGDEVKQGQLVAKLEADDLVAERDVRRADLAVARSTLAELLAGSRPEEIAAAKAAADRAKAVLEELENGARTEEKDEARARTARAAAEEKYASTSLGRTEGLLSRKVVPPEEGDRALLAADSAKAKVAEARAAQALIEAGPRREEIAAAHASLAEAEARLAEIRSGPRKETIATARARVERARAALGQAETTLAHAEVSSPLTGVVLSKSVEPGEFVAPGTPVVTVGDLDEIFVRAYIPETELGRVKLGQRVRVTADTWPGRVYVGRITFLSPEAEFTPKNVQTPEERVKLVYRIKVTVPNPRHELKPGMPVDGEIFPGTGE